MVERLWLQIRSMGIFFFLPFIGYFVFIPFCVLVLNRTETEAIAQTDMVTKICYQFVPILSTIWIYMFHREYVEGNGREVLILGKGVSGLTFLFWLANIFCFLPIFLFSDYLRGGETDLFLEMATVSFMICGLAFFLNFAMNSISLSALVVMLYVMFANVDLSNVVEIGSDTQKQEQISGFFYTVLRTTGVFSFEGGMYIVAGVVFWLLGFWKALRL